MNLDGFVLLAVALPWIGGIIIWVAGKRLNNYSSCITVIISLGILLGSACIHPLVYAGNWSGEIKRFFMGEMLLTITPLGYVFIILTALVWFAASILAIPYMRDSHNKGRFYCFFLLTLGATLGVFISGDMITLFTFFEIMSFTSFVLVVHEQHKEAIEAGKLYIYMSVFGGLLILMGLFMLQHRAGTLEIQELYNILSGMGNERYSIYLLITLGFSVKAGMLPFHIWLPEAHPAAPSPASAILSGILLKTGIYGIILTSYVFLGGDRIISHLIAVLGVLTMVAGALQALKGNNLKRMLAYSSVSQMGYVILSIGIAMAMGNEGWVSYAGAVYQAVNHGLYEAMLFLAAGYLYLLTGTVQLDRLKGIGRKSILPPVFIFTGLAAISGLPGLNGFVGKTLIHEGIIEAYHYTHHIVYLTYEWAFIAGSAFTAAYCFKIIMFLMARDNDGEIMAEQDMGRIIPGFLSLGILTLGMVLTGLMPEIILRLIEPYFSAYHISEPHIFSAEALISSVKVYLIGFGVFLIYLKKDMLAAYLEKVNVPGIVWAEILVCLFVFVKRTLKLLDIILSIDDRSYRVCTNGIYKFLHGIFRYADRGTERLYVRLTGFLTGIYHRENREEENIQPEEEREGHTGYKDIIEETYAGLYREAGRKLRRIFREHEFNTFDLNIGIIIFAAMIVVLMFILMLYVPSLANRMAVC